MEKGFSRATALAGGLSAVLGGVVLLGWYARWAPVLQVLPSLPPMPANAALCFLCCGLGLGAVGLGRRWPAAVAAPLVATVATLTLAEHVFRVDLGLDQVLVRAYFTTLTYQPGRMASDAAACFLLVAGALALLAWSRPSEERAVLLAGLAAAVGLIAGVALVRYAAGWAQAPQSIELSRVALHSAVGFVLLAIGVACAPGRVPRETGRPRWPSVVVGLAVVGLMLAHRRSLLFYEQRQLHQSMHALAEALARQTEGEFEGRILAVGRMARRWDVHGGMSRQEFEAEARWYVRDRPGLYTVARLDPSLRVDWAAPRPIDVAESLDPRRAAWRDALEVVRVRRQTVIFAPGSLDDTSFVALAPLYVGDRFDGAVVGILRVPDFFAALVDFAPEYTLAVRMAGRERYRRAPADSVPTGLGESVTLVLGGTKVRLHVSPTAALLGRRRSPIPEFALVSALVVAVLFGAAVFGRQTARWQAGRIDAANRSLRREAAERERAEAGLRRSEATLRRLFDAAPDPIIVVGRQGQVVRVNPEVERTFGYAAEELLGRPIGVLVPQGPGPPRAGEIAGPAVGGPRARVDAVGRHKDGSEVPLEITLGPLAPEEDAVIAVARDVSERRRAEERIVRYAEEVERRNQELDQFSYVASHDLQEPLRKITAFGDLLERDLGRDLPEKAREDLHFMIEAAGRMRTLIQDLLALSRAARTSLEKRRVPLDVCVDRAIEAVRVRLAETGARVERDALPEVMGDPTLLAQLYQNLIVNALKFCDKPRPEIHLTVAGENGRTVFGVRDNGIGIEPRYQTQIFAPFKRLHRREEYPGTGIGLAIASKVVERHGGTLWVDSTPGEGAHFKFTLGESPEKEERHG